MKWTKMEDLRYHNSFWNTELQTSYTYTCETTLFNEHGDKVGMIARWRATSGECTGSVYRPWVFYNGTQPISLGDQYDMTLKECKQYVIQNYLLLPQCMKRLGERLMST